MTESPETRAGRHLRRIRLDREVYARLNAVCSVTIAVLERRPVFADQVIASGAVDVLRRLASESGVPVYGYCVMPDHVHIVLGPSATCDIVTFVGRFKSLAVRAAWNHGVRGTFWQRSFWDHFVRSDETVESVVRYVLWNPVRSGLVARWQEYPFSGSLVFRLQR
jgi:REP element-mobilizing transposase RayT